MKLKRSLAIVLASFVTASAHGGTLPESPPSAWNPGSFGFSATSEYFTSSANYDDGRGSYTKLPGGNSFTNFETRAKARYAFAHAVSAYGGLGFAQSKAVDTTTEKTNANVTDFVVGANFQLVRRWWRVIPEFEMSLPIESASATQTVPLTSEGVWSTRTGVFLFKPYKHFRLESYLGFLYLGEGLSKRFLYSLLAETQVGGFMLGGGVAGMESLLSDEKSAASRAVTQALANAGSRRYWAHNPAMIEARGWLGYRLDRAFTTRLGIAKTLNGMRTAEGFTVLVSLAYNSPGDRAAGRAARMGTTKKDLPPGDGFQTDPEVNDPELFDQGADPVVAPPPTRGNQLDEAEKIIERK